jgi:hypothetical protein
VVIKKFSLGIKILDDDQKFQAMIEIFLAKNKNF